MQILAVMSYGTQSKSHLGKRRSCIKFGNGIAITLIEILFKDIAINLSTKRESYNYIHIPKKPKLRKGWLFIQISEQELKLVESYTSQAAHGYDVCLWQNGRWLNLPSQEKPEYQEAKHRNPGNSPLGFWSIDTKGNVGATGGSKQRDILILEYSKLDPVKAAHWILPGNDKTFALQGQIKSAGAFWERRRHAYVYIGDQVPERLLNLVQNAEECRAIMQGMSPEEAKILYRPSENEEAEDPDIEDEAESYADEELETETASNHAETESDSADDSDHLAERLAKIKAFNLQEEDEQDTSSTQLRNPNTENPHSQSTLEIDEVIKMLRDKIWQIDIAARGTSKTISVWHGNDAVGVLSHNDLEELIARMKVLHEADLAANAKTNPSTNTGTSNNANTATKLPATELLLDEVYKKWKNSFSSQSGRMIETHMSHLEKIGDESLSLRQILERAVQDPNTIAEEGKNPHQKYQTLYFQRQVWTLNPYSSSYYASLEEAQAKLKTSPDSIVRDKQENTPEEAATRPQTNHRPVKINIETLMGPRPELYDLIIREIFGGIAELIVKDSGEVVIVTQRGFSIFSEKIQLNPADETDFAYYYYFRPVFSIVEKVRENSSASFNAIYNRWEFHDNASLMAIAYALQEYQYARHYPKEDSREDLLPNWLASLITANQVENSHLRKDSFLSQVYAHFSNGKQDLWVSEYNRSEEKLRAYCYSEDKGGSWHNFPVDSLQEQVLLGLYRDPEFFPKRLATILKLSEKYPRYNYDEKFFAEALAKWQAKLKAQDLQAATHLLARNVSIGLSRQLLITLIEDAAQSPIVRSLIQNIDKNKIHSSYHFNFTNRAGQHTQIANDYFLFLYEEICNYEKAQNKENIPSAIPMDKLLYLSKETNLKSGLILERGTAYVAINIRPSSDPCNPEIEIEFTEKKNRERRITTKSWVRESDLVEGHRYQVNDTVFAIHTIKTQGLEVAAGTLGSISKRHPYNKEFGRSRAYSYDILFENIGTILVFETDIQTEAPKLPNVEANKDSENYLFAIDEKVYASPRLHPISNIEGTIKARCKKCLNIRGDFEEGYAVATEDGMLYVFASELSHEARSFTIVQEILSPHLKAEQRRNHERAVADYERARARIQLSLKEQVRNLSTDCSEIAAKLFAKAKSQETGKDGIEVLEENRDIIAVRREFRFTKGIIHKWYFDDKKDEEYTLNLKASGARLVEQNKVWIIEEDALVSELNKVLESLCKAPCVCEAYEGPKGWYPAPKLGGWVACKMCNPNQDNRPESPTASPVSVQKPNTGQTQIQTAEKPAIVVKKLNPEEISEELRTAVRESKIAIREQREKAGDPEDSSLASCEEAVGELSGSTNGHALCHGYAIYKGQCVYLNMLGPRQALEAIRASLGQGKNINLLPYDGIAIELGPGEDKKGQYRLSVNSIQEARVASMILVHKYFEDPIYRGKSTTYIIELNTEQKLKQLHYHLHQLMTVSIFSTWVEFLWLAGEKAGLINKCQSNEKLKVYALELDSETWARLIQVSLAEKLIELPQEGILNSEAIKLSS